MTSGGARPGAGRKPIPQEKHRVQFSVSVDPLTREKWRDVRRYFGPKANQLMEEFIDKLFRKVQQLRKK